MKQHNIIPVARIPRSPIHVGNGSLCGGFNCIKGYPLAITFQRRDIDTFMKTRKTIGSVAIESEPSAFRIAVAGLHENVGNHTAVELGLKGWRNQMEFNERSIHLFKLCENTRTPYEKEKQRKKAHKIKHADREKVPVRGKASGSYSHSIVAGGLEEIS